MSRGRFLLAVALAGAVSAGGAFAAVSLTAATRVPVAEKEWGVIPKPVSVKAGKVTFVVKNIGLWAGKPYLVYSLQSDDLAAFRIEDGQIEAVPVTS